MQKELTQAINIKDRQNRKAVIRALTMLLHLHHHPNKVGYLMFVGLAEDGTEISELVTPLTPITEFYYSCGRRFVVDRFAELFTPPTNGSVTFISGAETLVYRFDGQFHKVQTIPALIAKRHKKGGQSSVRFSRLAEESRVSYVERVVEYLNSLTSSINWIFGGQELKGQVLHSSNLKIDLQTEDSYHTFTADTIRDRYFLQLMKARDEQKERRIAEIVSLLERDPDYLLFSEEDIVARADEIKFVIDAREIEYSSPHYARLRGLQRIAKLWYTTLTTVE